MTPASGNDSTRPPEDRPRARRRAPLVALWVVLGLGLLALAASVIANTRFTLDGATLQSGEVTVETDFPNARCAKTLKRTFPFVSFRCDPLEPDEGGEGPSGR